MLDPTSPVPAKLRCPADLVVRQRMDPDADDLYALFLQNDFQRNGWTLEPLTSVDDLVGVLIGTGGTNLEIVATIRDRIVGFAGIYVLPGRQGHTGTFVLNVHEGFQRLGIGTTLMKAVVGAGFHLMGLRRLQGTVFTDNARALSLYERFAFQIEGRLSRFALRDDGFVDAYVIALTP